MVLYLDEFLVLSFLLKVRTKEKTDNLRIFYTIIVVWS